jgi:hypothetical protein
MRHFRSLAVEPHDVVLGETETADGCFIIDADMEPMPVILMHPNWQAGFSVA